MILARSHAIRNSRWHEQHERRSDIARFRRDASSARLTYLAELDDPARDGAIR
jgi:hypothetical protein